MICAALTGKSPIGAPAQMALESGQRLTIDPALAATLQRTAAGAR